jgi:signal transduction histidine kinase
MSIDLAQAYQLHIREQLFRQSKIGCMVAATLMPGGALLDYFVYPDHIRILTITRIACSVAIAFILWLHYSFANHSWSRLLPFTWPVVLSLFICYMIFVTGGAPSPYYAGLNIVLIGIIFILPLQLMESIIFTLVTIIFYIITCMIAGNIFDDFEIFYSNLNFLTLTGAVSCLVSHVNSNSNFEQFRLSFQLNQKNLQLTKLERLRTNFFSNISHELRTPLTLILSPIQDLLQNGTDIPQRIRNILLTSHTNALRLLKLVNDLLEVIRIEEGKSQLNFKPLLVDRFLDELVDSVSYLALKRHIHINKSLHSPGVQSQLDSYAFEKIIINLLHNAIKFSPEHSTIAVKTEPAGDHIRIRVVDHGIGIGPEELPFIFDRFRQADASSTRQYQGSGLGLSLVKDLTDQLNGFINVLSEPGVGTTFNLYFPVHDTLPPDSQVSMIPLETQDSMHRLFSLANRSGMLHVENDKPALGPNNNHSESKLTPHTILVVEDEPDLREYLVASLSATYPVLEAVDGAAALAAINEHKPALVVLDLMLPEIDGLEVCARIKGKAATRNTKIILLTARIDESAKLTALDNGADDFLTKPFSTLELQTRIRNLLQNVEFEQALANANTSLQQTLAELKDTQAQLIQSEKTHALEYLSAGILHEINNPLNYTLTALQLAKGLPEATENALLHDIFEDMHEGMLRIKGIVGDLQTFAHPSPVDKQAVFKLADAVRTALNFTSQDAISVTIHNEIEPDIQVVGSRNHIVQVLINLITNAIKATRAVEHLRKGEIVIHSSFIPGRVCIFVKDNGTGIDREILDKIFDPFFTTRDVGEGMGLGLSVSQTIIKVHGGSLKVNSQPGEWTEFGFDLELSHPAGGGMSALN